MQRTGCFRKRHRKEGDASEKGPEKKGSGEEKEGKEGDTEERGHRREGGREGGRGQIRSGQRG